MSIFMKQTGKIQPIHPSKILMNIPLLYINLLGSIIITLENHKISSKSVNSLHFQIHFFDLDSLKALII